MLSTRLISSLETVYLDSCPSPSEEPLCAFANEPCSFQIAYTETEKCRHINISVESNIPLELYAVGNVMVNHYHESVADQSRHYVPDMLTPIRYEEPIENHPYPWTNYYVQGKNDVQLDALCGEWSSLWVTVNEEGIPLAAGDYPVTISFFDEQNELLTKESTTVTVIKKELPSQTLCVTNWFHADCLADYYRVEIFSDDFFAIMENYLKVAADHGNNMVLLPAFTPPLDTGVGTYRRKAQLVKVRVTDKGYDFDFGLMEKYAEVARKAGITHFEHAHLFSQWGAKQAAVIYADVKNESGEWQEVELFGWKTAAASPEYLAFVKEYMKAFRTFADKQGIIDKTLIHISDEPSASQGNGYELAYDAMKESLQGFMQGDALSEYAYYENGVVKCPIVVTTEIEKFRGKCKHYWCYYTCQENGNGYSNRAIGFTPANNRAIGYQMYGYGVEGFLHWGLNYWYHAMSVGLVDPKCNTSPYGTAAGASYLVYPYYDGTALPSVRQKVFFEGILDFRALTLLEKEKGREVAEALLNKHFGEISFSKTPETPAPFFAFRRELIELLKA